MSKSLNTKLVLGWIVIQMMHPVQTNKTCPPLPEDAVGPGSKAQVQETAPGHPWAAGRNFADHELTVVVSMRRGNFGASAANSHLLHPEKKQGKMG